jgi:hypothetical protein
MKMDTLVLQVRVLIDIPRSIYEYPNIEDHSNKVVRYHADLDKLCLTRWK